MILHSRGPGPDEASRRLVEALKRHPPQQSWEIGQHRDVFERAAAGRRDELPLHHRVPVRTPGGQAEWLLPSGTTPRLLSTVLYLHGGGYVMGSLETIRPLALELMSASGADVLTLDYRPAPETPFPAAAEDAFAAYRWLLELGHESNRIAIAGDSAGGGLALACMLRAREEGLPLPLAGYLISPLLDLTLSSSTIDEHEAKDPQAPRWLLELMARSYLNGALPTDPLASPIFAELSGLPPILIQVGSEEGLIGDSVHFHENASAAGVDVTVECWDGMPHVWHAFAPRLTQARLAVEAAAEWLRTRGL